MFSKLWRQKWRILIVLIVLALGFYYWNFIREPDWRASAIEDVDFIRDTIRDDHPGYVDGDNPAFRTTLDEAYRQASEMARQVDSPAGYYYATRAMTMPFQDAHLAVQFYRDLPRERRWPGFFVGMADNEIEVIHSEGNSGPAVGARLVQCDGKSPEALYAERVLPFNFLSWLPAFERGDWPWVLIDSGNPFTEPLASCTFELRGEEEAFTLSWKPLDDATREEILEPIEPDVEAQTALRFVDGNIAWISIASFFDSGEEVSEDLAALIADISARRDKLEASDALVIDVRGNVGGASKAGYEVASAIWGDGYIKDRIPAYTSADWRASESNLERLDDAMLPLRIQFGADSELYRTVVEIRDGLAAAVSAGDAYFVQKQSKPAITGDDPLPLPGKVYFLTDNRCVSACLDFADLMMAIDGVRHIGHETAGDSRYLEVVAADLPSGIGQLVYPTAIHRGRERAVNASYVPQIAFTGDISDGDALIKWVNALKGAPSQ